MVLFSCVATPRVHGGGKTVRTRLAAARRRFGHGLRLHLALRGMGAATYNRASPEERCDRARKPEAFRHRALPGSGTAGAAGAAIRQTTALTRPARSR